MVKYPGFARGGGGGGEVSNSSAHNGFQVIVCRASWVSLLWWVVVGSGRAGGRKGHTQCKECKKIMNFELFWSEIGYRLLKQPGYGFDLELGMGFR